MSDFLVHPDPPPDLRADYLAALPEPQEWFLEEILRTGVIWLHADGSYAVMQDRILVEFFSADPSKTVARLRAFHGQVGFASALVKSFDRAVVTAFGALGWTAAVGGILFRKRVAASGNGSDIARMRAAMPGDVPALWRMNDAFFDSEAEVARLVRAGSIRVAQVGEDPIGCGLLNRIFEDGNAVDIGMLVARAWRRQGLGAFIVGALADAVEKEGLRPVCGCGANNHASRATLEKAGFVSEHQLLNFTP